MLSQYLQTCNHKVGVNGFEATLAQLKVTECLTPKSVEEQSEVRCRRGIAQYSNVTLDNSIVRYTNYSIWYSMVHTLSIVFSIVYARRP